MYLLPRRNETKGGSHLLISSNTRESQIKRTRVHVFARGWWCFYLGNYYEIKLDNDRKEWEDAAPSPFPGIQALLYYADAEPADGSSKPWRGFTQKGR